MTRCRSCGAPIVWAVTAAGKRMPLDAEPVYAIGSGVVSLNGDEVAVVERPRPLYVSHFATCPNADQHRRST